MKIILSHLGLKSQKNTLISSGNSLLHGRFKQSIKIMSVNTPILLM